MPPPITSGHGLVRPAGDVTLAALVGQPDPYAGELPVAYVQPKPGQTVTPAELIGWLREHTPERAAVPVALHLIDTMPRNAGGKIFKPALRLGALRGVGAQHARPGRGPPRAGGRQKR